MKLVVADVRMYFSIYAMLRVSTMLVSSFKDRNIRRKHSYFGQERFWLIKGWTYKEQNKLVPFPRWCKLIAGKEIWAFEREVTDRYITYRFCIGTGPCANLAKILHERARRLNLRMPKKSMT